MLMRQSDGTHSGFYLYVFRSILLSLWGLPIACICATVGAFGLLVFADAAGGSDWLASLGWPLDIGPQTAIDVASTLANVAATLLTLFFSITLLVLTIAAGNFGVRLIDRWINRDTIRTTLAILLSLLTFAILTTAVITVEPEQAFVPRITLLVLIVSTIATLAWVAYAFDHLSNAVHVDTSIARIGADLGDSLMDRNVAGGKVKESSEQAAREYSSSDAINAWSDGYIESIDVLVLVEYGGKHDCFIRVEQQLGHFVICGQAIATTESDKEFSKSELAACHEMLKDAITIAPHRSDQQGSHFRADLLVEIACRALSPAVNDIYTALCCIDYLGAAFAKATGTEARTGWFADQSAVPRCYIAGLRWTEVAERPLQVLRQSIGDYPEVIKRLLQILHRIWLSSSCEVDRNFVAQEAKKIVTTAMTNVKDEADRQMIQSLLADFV